MLTSPAPVRDAALLIARIGVGIIMIAQGWQKLVTNGVDGTAAFFGQVGVPLLTVSAWFATIMGLAGGSALVLGVALPSPAAARGRHGRRVPVRARRQGRLRQPGRWELVLALGVTSLLLAAVGAARFSLDHVLFGRRSEARVRETGRV